MKKAIVFVDYGFCCDFIDENTKYNAEDCMPLQPLADSFTGGTELSLEHCDDFYIILDCKTTESAACKIISEHISSVYGVDPATILEDIQFWPSSKYGAIPDLAPEKLNTYSANERSARYKIEFRFSLNFDEDYEEAYPVLRSEGINMPAYQMINELKQRADVEEVYGCINVICRGDVHKVVEFIENRLPELARNTDIDGVGFLTWETLK